MTKPYQTAIYLRLSREDAEKERESNSISNQRSLIMDYINNHEDLAFSAEFIDDGVSGFDFDRPQFDKMIGSVKRGENNCIIVKDLSRLGRNFQRTEEFMQRNFPKLGVRFIAILNGYDSAKELSAGERLAVPVANLLNEYHVMETSKKVRDALENCRKKGKLVSGKTSYGYILKDKRIEIDPQAEKNIRKIFDLKIGGMSNQAIANFLNKEGVLSPLEHKLMQTDSVPGQHFRKGEKACWSSQSVCRILSDPIYTGSLVQGKTFSRSYRDKRRYNKDPSEWAIFENSHEAIITETVFQIVADLLSKDSYSNSSSKSYLFTGFALCGNCEGTLFHRTSGNNVYWQCMNKVCKDKRNINEKNLVTVVHEILKSHIKSVLGSSPVVKSQISHSSDSDFRAAELDKQIERIGKTKSNLCTQLKDGVISSVEYEEMNSFYEAKVTKLYAQKNEIINKKNKLLSCIDDITSRFKKYYEMPELTREIVATFIDRIVVESKTSVNIFFRYSDFFTNSGGESNGS
jgi:DNA invertase Pin-like site-specific DNA recombinase